MNSETMVCTVAHGSIYMRAGDLCKKFGISPATVTSIKKGIEALADTRYAKAHPFLNKDAGDRFFNELVVIDYLENRARLDEKNLRRAVPPYDPSAVRFALGEYKTPIRDDSEDARKLDKIIELLSACNRRQQENADMLHLLISGKPTKKDLKAIADGNRKCGEEIRQAAGGVCEYMDSVGA